MLKILFCHQGDQQMRGSEVAVLALLDNLDRERFEPIVWTDTKRH
jgi:hypothetical protein